MWVRAPARHWCGLTCTTHTLEGPAVEIGAFVSRLWCNATGGSMSIDRQLGLLGAGAAAGVAAGFNAPIAGGNT